MKQKIIIISIIALLIGVSFSGCVEENNNKNTKGIITTSILDLLLKVEDLPEGFTEKYLESEHTSQFSRLPEDKPVESYSIGFTIGNSSNESGYQLITCELNRFSSIEDAEKAFNPTLEHIITEGNFDVIDGSINIIGNESKGITRENYNRFLIFRILNVIGLVSSNDFELTIELAEIVEQRLRENINWNFVTIKILNH